MQIKASRVCFPFMWKLHIKVANITELVQLIFIILHIIQTIIFILVIFITPFQLMSFLIFLYCVNSWYEVFLLFHILFKLLSLSLLFLSQHFCPILWHYLGAYWKSQRTYLTKPLLKSTKIILLKMCCIMAII